MITILSLAAGGSSTASVSVELDYTFTRTGPDDAETASGSYTDELDPTDDEDLEVITQMYNAAVLDCDSDSSATSDITLSDFIYTYIRLTESATGEALGDFPA